MPPLQIPADVAARIAARLPDGKTVEDIRIVPVVGTVEVAPELTSQELAMASQVEAAGGPPMLSNGVPTIMRVVAWMCHEGTNKNGLTFLADDLGPAADRIREPNFLPMDWNHSGVFSWSFDPKAIGLWYRAEKRWDPKASEGKGAYGILIQGMVWSWMFPDYANTMLAEQARNGKIDFSMACIPARTELVIEDGRVTQEIAHEPVFFTHSALDVPPADPDAVGVGVEGSDDSELETKLTKQLTGEETDDVEEADDVAARLQLPQAPVFPAASPNATDDAALRAAAAAAHQESHSEEDQMDPEQMVAELEALREQIATLTTTETELATAQARIVELEQQLTEAQTAREGFAAAASEAAAAAETAHAELVARAEAAEARVAEYERVEREAAEATRFEARLAELPESYRAALQKRSEEEQTAFRARWTAASDEAWSVFKADALLGYENIQVSYLTLSNREGGVLNTAAGDGAPGEPRPIRSLLSEIRPATSAS